MTIWCYNENIVTGGYLTFHAQHTMFGIASYSDKPVNRSETLLCNTAYMPSN